MCVCCTSIVFGKLTEPNGVSSSFSMSKCIKTITEDYFKEDDVALVSLAITKTQKNASTIPLDQFLFNDLFDQDTFSIIVKKTNEPLEKERYLKKVENYIIQVREIDEIQKHLYMLNTSMSWNPHGKFTVISTTKFDDIEEVAASVIRELFLHKVSNGIVLLPTPRNASLSTIFTWFPYGKGACGDGYKRIVVADKCYLGEFQTNANLFPDKIPRTLNGCSVFVRTVVWPPYVFPPEANVTTELGGYEFRGGIEIKTMNAVAKLMNITVVYTVSEKKQDWGLIYSNGSGYGSLLLLKQEKVDIVMSSLAATNDRHTYFDAIPYNIPESLTWCVPHAEDEAGWKKMFQVVSLATILTMAFCYTVVTILAWKLSCKEPTETSSFKTISSTAQNMYCMMLGFVVRNQPRTLVVRTIFIIWAFCVFHVCVLYQTFLMSSLTSSKYEQEIKTVSQLMESNLNLWLLPESKTYFLGGNEIFGKEILSRWRDCDDVVFCLYQVAFDKDSAACVPRLFIEYAGNNFTTPNYEPMLYCFKDNVVTYPLEMYLRKGYALKDRINAIVDRLNAAGFSAHWESQIFDYQWSQFIQNNTRIFEVIDRHHLSFLELREIFILMIALHLLAIAVFIVEMLVQI